MQITVYDAAGVVGGNKILLETDGKNIFFDFGISYSTYANFFEEYLKPRAARGIVDYFAVGLLPPLDGIYRADYFPDGFSFKNYPAYRKLDVSGVLLSHAHLDHSGHIAFLDEKIPIYCSPLTAAISKAIQDTGLTELDKEVCYKVPREINDGGLLETSPWKSTSAIGRPFKLVNTNGIPDTLRDFWAHAASSRNLMSAPLEEITSIDGLHVNRYTVDHSILGSSAYAVQTNQGWVVYTGDLRLHGKKGNFTRTFAEEVRKLSPLVLITEGTRIKGKNETTDLDYGEGTDEESVFSNCLNAVKESKGLVIADFGARNLERLLIFLEIAKQLGKKLAIMAKDAYLLEAAHSSAPDEIAHPLEEDALVIYRDVKSKPKNWEKILIERYDRKIVAGKSLSARQKDYIVCMSFFDINDLIDFTPDDGSVYVYSSSEAYTEEQKIDFRRLLNWLNLLKIKPIGVPDPVTGKASPDEIGLHASGHITAPQLLDIIRTINPKIVVPVHTEHPEFFTKELQEYQVLVPERGKPIIL